MTKNKKIVVGVVLGVTLLVGSLVGGVVLAADSGGNGTTDPRDAMWEKVAQLYLDKTGTSLDQEALKASFKEAMDEMRQNAGQKSENWNGEAPREMPSMQERLQNMVENGKLTQEQADAYLQWWNAKPDLGFGPSNEGTAPKEIPTLQERLQKMVDDGKITQEKADAYLKWWNAKPDVDLGFPFGGHRGPCPLPPPAE